MERSGEEGSSSSSPSTSTLLPLQNPNISANTSAIRRPRWPTIDGPLGLSEEDSVTYARRFYKFGFLLLPWLWAVNCFYFWPVLRHSHSFPSIRRCMYSIFLSLLDFSHFPWNFLNWVCLSLMDFSIYDWEIRCPFQNLMILWTGFAFGFSFVQWIVSFWLRVLGTHFRSEDNTIWYAFHFSFV